jgi:hypothetical protein
MRQIGLRNISIRGKERTAYEFTVKCERILIDCESAPVLVDHSKKNSFDNGICWYVCIKCVKTFDEENGKDTNGMERERERERERKGKRSIHFVNEWTRKWQRNRKWSINNELSYVEQWEVRLWSRSIFDVTRREKFDCIIEENAIYSVKVNDEKKHSPV